MLIICKGGNLCIAALEIKEVVMCWLEEQRPISFVYVEVKGIHKYSYS